MKDNEEHTEKGEFIVEKLIEYIDNKLSQGLRCKSYPWVFLKFLIELNQKEPHVLVEEIISASYSFYKARAKNGLWPDVKADWRIINIDSTSKSELKSVFESQTLPELKEMQIISTGKLGMHEVVVLNGSISNETSTTGLKEIQGLIESGLTRYYDLIDEDPKYSHSYRPTKRLRHAEINSSLDRTKKRITKLFLKRSLIGDIPISDVEYEGLLPVLREHISHIKPRSIKPMDPISLILMVQIGVRKYDGNYWGNFASEIGYGVLPANQQTSIGEAFIEGCQKYGKPILREKDRVSTILMHGFVSKYYAKSMFDFFYKFYDLDLDRDISKFDSDQLNELIEVIMENKKRAYMLVQQTADAIGISSRSSKIRIRRIIRLLDNFYIKDKLPMNPSSRITKYFLQWCEIRAKEINSKRSSNETRSGKLFSSPTIRFDLDEGTKVLLPKQILKDNSIVSAFWVDSCNNRYEVELYEVVTGMKTSEMEIPIDIADIFSRLTFTLVDGGGTELKRFVIRPSQVRFFDMEGVLIITSQKSLPSGEIICVSPKENTLITTGSMSSVIMGELKVSQLSVVDGDYIVVGDDYYYVGYNERSRVLTNRGLIKGLVGKASSEDCSVYNAPPLLNISIISTYIKGTVIRVNGRANELSGIEPQFPPVTYRNETTFCISTKDIGVDTDGIYKIVIDHPRRKSTEYTFILIKDFCCDYTASPYVLSNKAEISIRSNYPVLRAQDGKRIKNAMQFVIDAYEPVFKLKVEMPNNELLLESKIPVIRWKFDQSEWEIESPKEMWHKRLPRIITIDANGLDVAIGVDDSDEDSVLTRALKGNRKKDGLIEFDTSRLGSWLNYASTKKVVILETQSEIFKFFTIRLKSELTSVLISQDRKNGILHGNCSVDGEGEYYVDISIKTEKGQERLIEKLLIEDGIFEHPMKTYSGTYVLDFFEKDSQLGFHYEPIGTRKVKVIMPNSLIGSRFRINKLVRMADKRNYNLYEIQYSIILTERARDADSERMNGFVFIGQLEALDVISGKKSIWRIKADFPDPSNLTICLLTIDTDEDASKQNNANVADIDWTTLLYDKHTERLVIDEDIKLTSFERYRRYDVLFDDKFIFVLSPEERTY